MSAQRVAVGLIFQAVCMLAAANQPPLGQLGHHFANTNYEIIWAATNTLPEALWVYRVLTDKISHHVAGGGKPLSLFSSSEPSQLARSQGKVQRFSYTYNLPVSQKLGKIRHPPNPPETPAQSAADRHGQRTR